MPRVMDENKLRELLEHLITARWRVEQLAEVMKVTDRTILRWLHVLLDRGFDVVKRGKTYNVEM